MPRYKVYDLLTYLRLTYLLTALFIMFYFLYASCTFSAVSSSPSDDLDVITA